MNTYHITWAFFSHHELKPCCCKVTWICYFVLDPNLDECYLNVWWRNKVFASASPFQLPCTQDYFTSWLKSDIWWCVRPLQRHVCFGWTPILDFVSCFCSVTTGQRGSVYGQYGEEERPQPPITVSACIWRVSINRNWNSNLSFF